MNPVRSHGVLLSGMICDMRISLDIISTNFAWERYSATCYVRSRGSLRALATSNAACL